MLVGVARLVRDFRLSKRVAAAKPTFTRMLAKIFNKDFADSTRALMSVCMYLRVFTANIPTPMEAGHVPLPEFPWTREWLQEDEVSLIGVDETG